MQLGFQKNLGRDANGSIFGGLGFRIYILRFQVLYFNSSCGLRGTVYAPRPIGGNELMSRSATLATSSDSSILLGRSHMTHCHLFPLLFILGGVPDRVSFHGSSFMARRMSDLCLSGATFQSSVGSASFHIPSASM